MRCTKHLLTLSILLFFAAAKMVIADTSLTVGNSSGSVGEQIDVPITVSNPANIAGASFAITYDTSALELNQVNTEFFPLFPSMGIPDADPVVVDGVEYYRAMTGRVYPGTGAMIAAARTTTGETNTTLFILRFTILAGATAPSYNIGIEPSVISNTDAGYDSEGEEIPMLISISGDEYPAESVTGISAGTVTVSSESPDDSDGDGIPDQWERDNVPTGVDPNSPDALNVFSSNGDYDHDGYTDFVEFQNDGMSDPLGMPFSPTFINAPGGPGYDHETDRQVANDFNCDGTSDFLARNSTNSNVYVSSMSNSRITSYNAVASFPAYWEFIGMGDFNGDGTSDFLARNSTNSNVYVFNMSDSRITSYNEVARFPAEWEFVGTGDYNGDGTSDVMALNTTNSNVYVYNMSDSRITSYNEVARFPAEWKFVGTGDYNGDGTSDVMALNTNSGQVYAYNMANSRIATYNAVAMFPADWELVGIGDYNGDGASDFMAQNTTSRVVYAFNMANSRIATYNAVATFPGEWTIFE